MQVLAVGFLRKRREILRTQTRGLFREHMATRFQCQINNRWGDARLHGHHGHRWLLLRQH